MVSKHFDLDEARAAASQNMTKLHREDTFCDLTVNYGDLSIKVHRVVLAASSDWFLKACTGGFKEGSSDSITLKDDDEEDVASMIEFCYTFSYADARAEDCGPMTKAVRMFAIGDKYLMNSLIRCAADRFAHHSQESWTEEDFFAAVKLVYTETSDPQRLLRSTIVKVIRERYIGDEPWKMVFSNLLDTTPQVSQPMHFAQSPRP